MFPLGGIFSDLSGDFPEILAAKRARRDYFLCILLAILLPAILFGLSLLIDTTPTITEIPK